MIKIIGCSGGPDSMALLDILVKQYSQEVVVCHVNYQKRETAKRDEEIVVSYCRAHHIPYHILRPVYTHEGNFQSWARDVRYDFFEEIAKRYQTNEIYVAHHLDDLLETYQMQKQRNILCDHYGLAQKIQRHGFWIFRPLLSMDKDDLLARCQEHGISYGIDESNLGNDYQRNRIRHQWIEKLDKEEKYQWLVQIEAENHEMEEKRNKAEDFLKKWDQSVKSLLSYGEPWFLLDLYLYKHTHRHYGKKHLLSLCEQIQEDCLIDLQEYELESYQGMLFCEKKREPISIRYNSLEELKMPFFSQTGKVIQGITFTKDDFPIVLRNTKPGDVIELRFGKKKVSRFFIDRKKNRIVRKKWLVIENNEKKVIFVPELGCDVQHFSAKPNVFMLQCFL